MQFANKHKCGMVRDPKQAWKPYPVSDCASCMVADEPSEGPLQALEPVKPPKSGRAPDDVIVRPPRELQRQRVKDRWDKIRSASKRRMFLVLALAVNGPMRATAFYALVQRTYAVSSKRLYKDIQELVELRWVLAESVERENGPVWQSKTENLYSLNPQLVAMVTA